MNLLSIVLTTAGYFEYECSMQDNRNEFSVTAELKHNSIPYITVAICITILIEFNSGNEKL